MLNGLPLEGLYRVGPRLSLNSSGENVATSDPRYIARGKKTRHGPSNLIGQITGIGGCFPSHLLLATETRFRRALSPYLVSLGCHEVHDDIELVAQRSSYHWAWIGSSIVESDIVPPSSALYSLVWLRVPNVRNSKRMNCRRCVSTSCYRLAVRWV